MYTLSLVRVADTVGERVELVAGVVSRLRCVS